MFGAASVSIRRLDGNVLRFIGSAGPAASGMRAGLPERPFDRSNLNGRAMLEKRQIQIATNDLLDGTFAEADDGTMAFLRDTNVRTIVATPLLREGEAIGTIIVHRTEDLPIELNDLNLLSSFADQAVIAIENARLLGELRESLDRQTATSEVLRVISSFPGDPAPVFQSLLENAARICEAEFGVLYRYDGAACYPAALVNAPLAYAEFVTTRGRFLPESGNALDRVLRTKQVIHTVDQAAEPVPTSSFKLAGARSQVIVPMLKGDELIGAIAIYRQEVRPFAEEQVSLLTNFASHAVIAIENARLLSELRESLDNQTASAEILRTIAASPGDAKGALDAIAETTTRLFGASGATIRTVHGDRLRIAGTSGPGGERLREALGEEIPLTPHSTPGAAILEKRQINIPDVANPDARIAHWVGFPAQRAAGTRSIAATPLMRETQAIGALMVQRSEPKPFTEKELAQLANFADQAVIAIENARLLDELNTRMRELAESLEQQTATSEILRTIASA
ncbi:MAG TPA: GAF domain-containing protein, partial [Steroidobacteraceae bacterium]